MSGARPRTIPHEFVLLGTDGFGLSGTRESLRRGFEVGAEHIGAAALAALHGSGSCRGRPSTKR